MALVARAEGIAEGTKHIHITLACQDEDSAWWDQGRGSWAPSFQVQSIGSKGWVMARRPRNLALQSDGFPSPKHREQGTGDGSVAQELSAIK